MRNPMAQDEPGARKDPVSEPMGAEASVAGDPDPIDRPLLRIVVAVDGSPASLDALRWAAQHAELIGATIEAVTCWEIPIGLGIEFPLPDTNWAAEAGTVLYSSIEEAIPEARAAVVGVVLHGPAPQALTAAAVGRHLLVVGSRGHGSVSSAVLGSVSEYVAAHAPCPVVIIRHTGDHEHSRPRHAVPGGRPTHP